MRRYVPKNTSSRTSRGKKTCRSSDPGREESAEESCLKKRVVCAWSREKKEHWTIHPTGGKVPAAFEWVRMRGKPASRRGFERGEEKAVSGRTKGRIADRGGGGTSSLLKREAGVVAERIYEVVTTAMAEKKILPHQRAK